VPGQRMEMPEGLGESRPMPLPHTSACPEDSVAGYYAETPWRLRSPAVRPPPASRPQDRNQPPCIKDSVSRRRQLSVTVSDRHWTRALARIAAVLPAERNVKHNPLPAQVWMTGVADDALSCRNECVACAHAYASIGMFTHNREIADRR
jgi:hypothetical protein